MQKGGVLIWIIIAILLTLSGLGIYKTGFHCFLLYKINNPCFIHTDPIPVWPNHNEYSNQTLSLKFKYPKELTVKEDTEEDFNKRGNGDFRKNFKSYVQYEPGKFLGAVVVLDKDQNFDNNPLTVWVFENPDNLTIDQWYKNYWYYPFVWGDFTDKGKIDYAPKDEATVSGQTGKAGIIDYQPNTPKFIYISNKRKIYLFRIIGVRGDEVLYLVKLLEEESDNDEARDTKGCKIGGCSSQLCVEEGDDGISTCEYLAEYSCYRSAKCERQSDGECAWTQTDELRQCIEEKRSEVAGSETYCHRFNDRTCPSACEVGPSCPECLDIGCHAKYAHQR